MELESNSMTNWVTQYAVKLKKLGVKFIHPEGTDGEIHINREGGDTYLHGNVHFDGADDWDIGGGGSDVDLAPIEERLTAVEESMTAVEEGKLSRTATQEEGMLSDLHLANGKRLQLHGNESRLYVKDDDDEIRTRLYGNGLVELRNELRIDRESGQVFVIKKAGVATGRIYSDGSFESYKEVSDSSKGSTLVTKDYLDSIRHRPPGLPFHFSSSDSIGSGAFHYTDAGGNKRMRINKTDADGIRWMDNSPERDTNTSENYSTAYSIREWDGSSKSWKMKMTGFITRIDWHANDVYCYIPLHYGKDGIAFTNNHKYWITIGGIL